MNIENINSRVLALLNENLAKDQEPLTPSAALSETVLLESVMVLEVVMLLEEEFDINLDRADLDSFDTPANIAGMVARKLPVTEN